ncbi:hypothetical protein AB0P16_11905 [Dietzia maris]|uniref:hypothetical protein n=1 Tax=Dietzia maris TaxID=37915 RepID=UPI0034350F75
MTVDGTPGSAGAEQALSEGLRHLSGERYLRARRRLDIARARFDDAGEPVRAARTELELGVVLMINGWFSASVESLGRAAVVLGEEDDLDSAGRARVWRAAALLAAGEIRAARYELDAAKALGDASDRYPFAVVSGRLAVELGSLGEAERWFDEADRRRPRDSSGIELELSRAKLDSARGRHTDVADRLDRVLGAVRSPGGRRDEARLRRRLGSAYRDLGRLDAARVEFDRARNEFADLGLGFDVAECDLRIGRLETVRGRYPEAERRLWAACRVFDWMGLHLFTASCDRLRAVVASESGRLDDATCLLVAARVGLVRGRRWREVADCDRELAEVDLEAGRPADAARDLARARRRYLTLGHRVGALWCDRGIAVVTAQSGDHEAAAAILELTAESFEELELPLDAAHCRRDLGGVLVSAGAGGEARRAIRAAREVFEDQHLTADVAWCALLDAEALALAGRPDDLREALEIAVPAVAMLHFQRYEFLGAGERTAWMRRLEPHLEVLADWAWRIGDERFLVDLVETLVNVGVRTPAGTVDRMPGPRPVDRASGPRPVDGVLLSLRPPPRLRMPGPAGHLVLEPWLGDDGGAWDAGAPPVDVR